MTSAWGKNKVKLKNMKASIKKSIKINASLNKIFNYIANPERSPEWVVNLTGVENISPKIPCIGQTWNWEYNMLGIKFRGRTIVTELSLQRYVRQTEGGIASTCAFTFKTENGDTRVDLEIDYIVPSSVFNKIADKERVKRTNENAAEHALGNIKTILE